MAKISRPPYTGAFYLQALENSAGSGYQGGAAAHWKRWCPSLKYQPASSSVDKVVINAGTLRQIAESDLLPQVRVGIIQQGDRHSTSVKLNDPGCVLLKSPNFAALRAVCGCRNICCIFT